MGTNLTATKCMRPFGAKALMNSGKSRETLAIANSHGPGLIYRLAPQHNYFSSHRSVNTTGTQLYPLPSLCKRPRAGKKDVCGVAIKTFSLASLASN
jgi:hypothetical protein